MANISFYTCTPFLILALAAYATAIASAHSDADAPVLQEGGGVKSRVSANALGLRDYPVAAIYARFIGLDNLWTHRSFAIQQPCYAVTYMTQIGASGVCMNWIGTAAGFNHEQDKLFAYAAGFWKAGSPQIRVHNNNKSIRFEPGMTISIEGSNKSLGTLSTATLSGDVWILTFDGATKADLRSDDSVFTSFVEIDTIAEGTAPIASMDLEVEKGTTGIEPTMLVFDRDAQAKKGAFSSSSHRGAVIGIVKSFSNTRITLAAPTTSLVNHGDRIGVTLLDREAGGGGGAMYVGIASATPYSQVVGYGTRVDCEGLSLGCAAFGQDITVQVEQGAANSNLFGAEYDFNNHSGKALPGSYGLWLQSTSEEPIGAGVLLDQYRSGPPTAFFKGILFHSGVQQTDLASEDNAGLLAFDVGTRLGAIGSIVPGGVGIFLAGRYQSDAVAIAMPQAIGGTDVRSTSSSSMISWVDPKQCADGLKCKSYHTYPTSFAIGPKSQDEMTIGSHTAPIRLSRTGTLSLPSVVSLGRFRLATLPKYCLDGDLVYVVDGVKQHEAEDQGSGVPAICSAEKRGGNATWFSLFGGKKLNLR